MAGDISYEDPPYRPNQEMSLSSSEVKLRIGMLAASLTINGRIVNISSQRDSSSVSTLNIDFAPLMR